MAGAEAGLELPIGLTEQKFLQQLARIEAKAIKASNGMAKKFATDNKAIADSFKSAADSGDVFTRELDAMRAKFDPLFASSKRYEASLGELNRAHKLGAISTKTYEGALEQLNLDLSSVSTGGRQLGATLGGMSGQTRSSLQNVSFQLQDIFVQIQGGQGITRALSQQLPQLASGFGLVGSAIGLVAAVAIPLAASFLDTAEEAASLEDAISDLNGALDTYYAAAEAANVPTSDLVEKYGLAAGAARELLEQIAQIAKIDAASTIRASATAVSESLQGALDALNKIDAATKALSPEDFLNEGTAAQREIVAQTERLNEEYGLSVSQARELQSILSDIQSSPEKAAEALQRLSGFLAEANEQSGYTKNNMLEANRATAEGALAGAQWAATMNDGAVSAADLAASVGSIDFSNPTAAAEQLSGVMGVMVGQAQDLLAKLGAAAKAARQRIQTQVATNNPLDPLGAFNGGRAANDAVQINAGGVIRSPIAPPIVEPSSSRGGGGGRRLSGGGSGGTGRAESPFFGDIEADLANLERQISLIGKSNEEVATAKARWELLDEAKKRGIPVNAELSAQIDAQAGAFGRLTAELERGEKSQQQFDQAVDGIADAMGNALIAGESLRDGLAQVLAGIASDILSSGIRQALAEQFGGGGGGLLSSIGGLFGLGRSDPGFMTGGYTGNGPRTQDAGRVHKGEYVMSAPAVQRIGLPNLEALHRGGSVQGSGGTYTFAPTINLGGSATQEDVAMLRAEMERERQSFAANVNRVNAETRTRRG